MPEINRVVINTDARTLLAEHGLVETERIWLRDRKPELCGDFTSMNKILADDVAHVPADVYVMTHATNPLLSAATIRRALAAYLDAVAAGQADSLFSVNRFQSRLYRADGSAINHDPQNLLRTQDLEPWFEENSHLYIFSRSSFEATGARIGRRPLLFETPRLESVDIDDEAGWTLAEIIALHQKLQESNER
jgi:CMP-N-acetylneuraminic acid synthetase